VDMAPQIDSTRATGLAGLAHLLDCHVPLDIEPEVQPNRDPALFTYFDNEFLRSLVQKDCLPRFHDFSYICDMAEEYQPLMNIALACAALALSFDEPTEDDGSMPRLRRRAVLYRHSGVSLITEFLQSGAADGTEDWILATVNGLMLFDVSFLPFHI
jgi:hypothetical protein